MGRLGDLLSESQSFYDDSVASHVRDTRAKLKSDLVSRGFKLSDVESMSDGELNENAKPKEEGSFDFSKNYSQEPSSQGRIEDLEYKNDAVIPQSGKNLQLPVDIGRDSEGNPLPAVNSEGKSLNKAEQEVVRRTGEITDLDKGITLEDINSKGGIEGYRSKNQTYAGKAAKTLGQFGMEALRTIGGTAAFLNDAIYKAGAVPVNYLMGNEQNNYSFFGGPMQEMVQGGTNKIEQEDLKIHTPEDIAQGDVLYKVKNFTRGGGFDLFGQIFSGLGTAAGAALTGTGIASGAGLLIKSTIGADAIASQLVKQGVAASAEDANILASQGAVSNQSLLKATASAAKDILIKNVVVNTPVAFLSAAGETAAQAYGAQEQLKQYWKDNNINLPEDEQEELLARLGNAEGAANMPLLMIGDLITWGKYLPGMSELGDKMTARFSSKVAGNAVEGYTAKSVVKGVGVAGLNVAKEANEEMAQSAFDKGFLGYYDALSNDKANEDVTKMRDYFWQGIKDQYAGGSKNWDDAWMGGIISILGVPVVHGGRLRWQGGLGSHISEIREDRKDSQEQAKTLNAILARNKDVNSHAVVDGAYEERKQKSLDDNDIYNYETSENSQFINDALYFHKAGRLNDFINQLEKGSKMDVNQIRGSFANGVNNFESLDDNELKSKIDIGTQGLKQYAKDVVKIYDNLKTVNPNASHESLVNTTMLLADGKHTDERIRDLSSDIEAKTGQMIQGDGSFLKSKEPISLLDYLGKKNKADKYTKDLSEFENIETNTRDVEKFTDDYLKKNPWDIGLKEKTDLLIKYVKRREEVSKQIQEWSEKDFDAEFEKKYNEKLTKLRREGQEKENQEHEDVASTITSEGVNPVVDDSKSNDDIEKENQIVENNISPESLPEVGDIKNEDAKGLITDKDEKIATLNKINKLSDKITKPTDAYYVKKDGKISKFARVGNVIKKSYTNHGIDEKPLADSRQRQAERHYKNLLENATPEEKKGIESKKNSIIEDKKTELRNQQIENNNTVSTEVGNVFDTLVKNVLLGKDAEELRDNFDNGIYEKALIQAQEIAKVINPTGKSTVYAKDLFLHTTNAKTNDTDGIAGLTNIVTVDPDGKVTIWGLKTTAGEYKGGEKVSYDHSQQLSACAIMLNNTYGIKADALKILDMNVKYKGDAKDFTINDAEFRGVKSADKILSSVGKNNELILKNFDSTENDSPRNNNTPGIEYRQPNIYNALKNIDVYSDSSNKTDLVPGSEITLRTTDKHQKDKDRNQDTVNIEMVDKNGKVVGALRYGDAKLDPEEQVKLKDIRSKLWNQGSDSKKADIGSIKQGVKELFDFVSELSKIGSAQQYSKYLDTIFPDSKVRDVVYHGSFNRFDDFDENKIGTGTTSIEDSRLGKGFYFTKNINEAINWGTDFSAQYEGITSKEFMQKGKLKQVILNINNNQDIDGDEIVARRKEQIHILGSRQDISGFKEYINQLNKNIGGQKTLKTFIGTNVEQKLAKTTDKGGFLGDRPGRSDMVVAGRYISGDIDTLKTESSDKTEEGKINYIKKDSVINYDSMKKAVTYILVPLNTNDKNTKYQAVEAISKPIKEMKEGEIKNAFIQTLFQFVKSQANNSLDSITISSDDVQNISNITYEKDVSKALSAATLATEKKTPYNAVFFLSQELVHISSENGKVYQDVITYGEINEGGKDIDDKVRKIIGFVKPQFRYNTGSISLMTGEKTSSSFALSKVLDDFISTTLSKNVTFEELQNKYNVKGIKAGFYTQVAFEIKPVTQDNKKNIEVIAPKISDEDREAFHLFNDILKENPSVKTDKNCE